MHNTAIFISFLCLFYFSRYVELYPKIRKSGMVMARGTRVMKVIVMTNHKPQWKYIFNFSDIIGLQISKQTNFKRFHDKGIRSHLMKKVPMSSKINMKKRLQFVNANQSLNLNNNMWSDECIFFWYQIDQRDVWGVLVKFIYSSVPKSC